MATDVVADGTLSLGETLASEERRFGTSIKRSCSMPLTWFSASGTRWMSLKIDANLFPRKRQNHPERSI